MKIGEREKLAKEAALALVGADSVRDRIVSFLSMGICDLSQSCYAIKCRVKAERSLISKVIHKRKTRPDYRPDSTTDIIGLRLLVLHHGDIITACRRFVDFLRFGLQSSAGLFAGQNLDSCIKEVIVYDSGQNNYVYQTIYEYFIH
jgi:hypothetical protein